MKYSKLILTFIIINICFAFNPSSGFLLEPIQRDTEVVFQYFHEDSSPASIMWDINADGTYDTTTTEGTLVFDYITYDTTQVIAKAIFDSTTFDMDTVSIALYDNLLHVSYEFMWECSLTLGSSRITDLSDSGDVAIVRDVQYIGDSRLLSTAIINNGVVTRFDSTSGGWILDESDEYLLRKYGYNELYDFIGISGLMYIDSISIVKEINGKLEYMYLAENDSFVLEYPGMMSKSMHYDGKMYTSSTIIFFNSRLIGSYVINGRKHSPVDENLAHQKNLEFVVKLMRSHPILTCFNKDGDTLFSKTDVYDFEPDSATFLGSLIHVDENDYIYTLIGNSFDYFGTVSFFDNEMLHGFNLLINQYNQSGIIQESDTMINVKTGTIMITDDAKYMIGCTETGVATKQMVCLWDFQTKELLFEHWFEDTDINTEISANFMYHEETDNIIVKTVCDSKSYWFNKEGNIIYTPPSRIDIYPKNPNFAYARYNDRILMYRVEWEPPLPPLPPLHPSPSLPSPSK